MLRRLIELKDEVLEDRFGSTNKMFFEGAGLVISGDYKAKNTGNFIIVKTQYASALSALVYHLKDICEGHLDYINKYDFYGRLGVAANKVIANHHDKKTLLLDVIDEAIHFVGEIETIKYFAYGSNMDVSQMSERCPSAKAIGVGRLNGYQFSLDSKGTATVIEQQHAFVWGVVWEIDGKDLATLDRYEGVREYCYSHSFVSVECDSQQHDVLVYISNREANHGARRSHYLEKIVNAADHWQFPENYRKVLGELL